MFTVSSTLLYRLVCVIPSILTMYPVEQSLAMNPKIKAMPALREVVMLGYGSMVAKYCAEDPTCPAELLKVIFLHVLSYL